MDNKTLEIVKRALGYYLGVPMTMRMHGVDAIRDALAEVNKETPSNPEIADDLHICETCKARYGGSRCPLCVEAIEVSEQEWDESESLESTITLACEKAGYHFGIGEGSGVAANEAMNWFKARRSVPMEKAVCPKCGQSITLIRFSPGVRDVICSSCQLLFHVKIEISVISPSNKPSKVKGEANE